MNNARKFSIRISTISLAVASLFIATAAQADDEELKALTQPKASVQVEVINVDNSSAKFGEYNGLNRQGGYVNGGFVVKGGSGYTQNEAGETARWSATGENLGLSSRSANISGGDQGSWSVGVNFDQLQHNFSNTYQTPYQGTMGGNSFTLPSNFYDAGKGISNTATVPNVITNDSQTWGISSTRYNTTLEGKAIIDKNSNISVEYNHLLQTGAKLGAVSSAKQSLTPPVPNNGANLDGTAILPMPTNSTTDTVNVAYNWVGQDANFSASYFGSFFQNNVNNVTFAPFMTSATSPATLNSATPMQTLSVAPSNVLNQINFNGGYAIAPKTKMTGNFSISQNSQNDGYSGTYDSFMVKAGTLPTSSLNGLVNNSHADLRVTDQSFQDLTLTALAKFDERDNLTQSNLYQFYSVDGYATTTKIGYQPNAPVSNKQTQLLVGGDYRLTKDQKIGLTLANNNVNRWCNQYGQTGTQYASSANCVTATSSNENKADLGYKLKVSEDLNLKAGLGYSNRKSQFNNTVYAAMPETPAQINAGDIRGFYPFFEASRIQYLAKAGLNWQASEALILSLGGKYTNDLYPDSTYGVQNGNSWSLNLDGTYAYSEMGTLNAYATQQNTQRALNNAVGNNTSGVTTLASGGAWSNTLQNYASTLGLGVKHAGLVDGKVNVAADLTYSIASSYYTTSQTASSSCATSLACGITPPIKNNMAAIKLAGNYQIDKNSKVGLMYWYQHLYASDFYYNGLQSGYTPTAVMPTNQTAPSYNVNVISANYTYTFD